MSIVISFGRWTRPYLFRSSVWGLCLGIVTVTVVRRELSDVELEGMLPSLKPLQPNGFISEL